MEVQVIWGLFIFGMFFLVMKLFFGLVFGSNHDFDSNANTTDSNTLWDEESESNNHEARVNEELAGLTDHNLGFYHTEV